MFDLIVSRVEMTRLAAAKSARSSAGLPAASCWRMNSVYPRSPMASRKDNIQIPAAIPA